MSFAHLSVGSVLAGLAALAGVLFLLQRLRVRHREVVVITTQFWREATEEAQARVLVDRFRHPLAYALILLIGALLWLGVAGPRADGGDGRDHALLLDASAAMAWRGRFDAAKESLAAAVAALPRDRTTVMLCGARPRTVLLPGENPLLLDERLRGLTPDACPETVTRTIRELSFTASDERPPAIRVFGDAVLPLERMRLLPDSVEVVRDAAPPREGTNAGIVALGVTDAASGSWTHVDVLVRATSAGVSATLDGAPLTAGAERDDDVTVFRDVPANGATVTATIAAANTNRGTDELSRDDTASVVLPSRRLITVSLPDDTPVALRRALELDPAVRIVASDADVIVSRRAEDLAETGRGILLRDGRGGGAAFIVHGAANADAPGSLRGAAHDLALDRIDATSLATDAGRAISMEFVNDDASYVEVWESLFTDAFDFTRQRAFPLFVARAVRRAAAVRDVVPVVAVAEALPPHWGPLRDTEGRTLDAADGMLAPFEAGVHTRADGARIHVAALETGAPVAASDEEVPDAPEPGGVPLDLTLLAGLAAAVLLSGEWLLYRAGRMP